MEDDKEDGKMIQSEKEIIDGSKENDMKTKDEEKLGTIDPPKFKLPNFFIGQRRGKPGVSSSSVTIAEDKPETNVVVDSVKNEDSEDRKLEKEMTGTDQNSAISVPYEEPPWGGQPPGQYKIEILKSGVIIDTIDLTKKSFYTVGRLPVCDIVHPHPSISRFHAILQFRSEKDGEHHPGLYIYDLDSTHGTFWNNNRIKPKIYVKLHGGHMVKFGFSDRKFILQSPEDDVEAESEFTVTELKERRRLELLEREKKKLELEELERIKKEAEEAAGIDWGMGEDANEDNDLTENPYASTNNEELFLDDPKKTLRGWFEREGHDLQYQVDEKAVGQYLCWISLPIDPSGRPIKVEVDYKGKKKEAVYQCALEACRTLDRYGLLRQATHEGRKRKARNWEEEDYYDSDEDNFLDRTGSVERKREQRMRNAGKLETKVETYTSLLEKHSKVVDEIKKIEDILQNHQNTKRLVDNSSEDALDAFMSNLNSSVLNKSDILKLKSQLSNLNKEEKALKKLVDIAKPATLPSLNVAQKEPVGSSANKSTKIQAQSPDKRLKTETVANNDDDDDKSKKLKGRYGLIFNEEIEPKKLTKIEKMTEEPTKNDDADDKINNKNDEDKSQMNISKENKKNQRKAQQKLQKAKDKPTNYDEDKFSEDYSTWVPPQNQSGDGKTTLNDKFGY